MKSLKLISFAFFLVLSALIFPKWGFAASPFLVTVGTTVPNGATNGASAFTAAGYPQVSGVARIRQINISNTGTVEKVTLWKNCTSSTVATAVWDILVTGSTNTAVTPGNASYQWLPVGMAITSPCISKGVLGAGAVNASISYE